MRRRTLLAVGLLLAACAGDDGDPDDGGSLGSTSSVAPPTAPAVPDPSPPGTGLVVVGDTSGSFAVSGCRLEPEGPTAEAALLLSLTGAGTDADGVAFQVEVQRFSAATNVETFTDTITYTDAARILQVQRVEVAGQVTDLRDADARGTLLRTRPDGLSATGLAGPPGSGGEDLVGIVGLSLDATC